MFKLWKPLRHFRDLAVVLFLSTLPATAFAAELIMVEQVGCYWCAKWDEEIAPIYPKTVEGKRAPLRRIDLYEDIPADLSFDLPLQFTPTFVLVEDGREVARIEGYPGEDFFWGLLGALINKLPKGDEAEDTS